MEPSRPLTAAARTRMPTLPDLSRARYGPGHAAVEVAGIGVGSPLPPDRISMKILR